MTAPRGDSTASTKSCAPASCPVLPEIVFRRSDLLSAPRLHRMQGPDNLDRSAGSTCFFAGGELAGDLLAGGDPHVAQRPRMGEELPQQPEPHRPSAHLR